MRIFESKSLLNSYLTPFYDSQTKIGFVPTMGALHSGHLSLLKKSILENELTVISIFVNPTQFNNIDDLKKYPRTLDVDVEKISSISDKIIVFAPTVDAIYEGKTISKQFNFDGLEDQMEGKFRPGHFNGVGTVVQRLFEIIKPTTAYFGKKDFQQLQIVKKLVEKYKLGVRIEGCEIYREKNGLAMSSRNERLSVNERDNAKIIFETLTVVKKLFNTKSVKKISKFVENTFKSNNQFQLEYFEIADEFSLISCKRKSKIKKYRAFIAVFVNNIRLIDTISLY